MARSPRAYRPGTRTPPAPGEGYTTPKYRHLLDDPNVLRWHRDNSKGSVHTAENYIQVLGLAMREMKTTPAAFVKQGQRKAEDALHDYFDACVRRLSRRTAQFRADVLASWMRWNRIPVIRRVKLPKPTYGESSRQKRVPGREDLRRTLQHMDARGKLITTSMAYSGMRPRVLADQDQQDGLRFRDLPEAHLKDGTITFDHVPTLVNVRAELSKNGKAYATFYSAEQCEYLATNVKERHAAGEKLTPDSLIIAPIKNCKSGFMSRTTLFYSVKDPMRQAGLGDVPPYAWKNYCADRMSMAEHDRDHRWTRDYRMFTMGHGGSDIAMLYALRQKLPPDSLEKLRSTFAHTATKYLEAFPVADQSDPKAEALRSLLQLVGYDADELNGMDVEGMDTEAFLKALHAGPKAKAILEQGARAREVDQVVVGSEAVQPLVSSGWVVKMQLQDGRVVMERHQPGPLSAQIHRP